MAHLAKNIPAIAATYRVETDPLVAEVRAIIAEEHQKGPEHPEAGQLVRGDPGRHPRAQPVEQAALAREQRDRLASAAREGLKVLHG